MRAKALFLLFFFSYLMAQSQPKAMWQVWHNGSIDRWEYSWGDEFDGTKVDDSKWIDSYPWGRNYSGTCYQEYMTPGQNHELEDGILKLIAKREYIFDRGVHYRADTAALSDGAPNLRGWNYTSGMIFSKEQFKHGLFEISCKLPNGIGFWPAFWLYAGNPNEEFDIFEFAGRAPQRMYYYMHCPKGCKGFGGNISIPENFSDRFHTFMGQWDENLSYWHLDGESYACWKGTLNHPAWLIANFGIANNKPCAFGPAPDSTTPFPAAFEIDHIRVWNRVENDFMIEMPIYTLNISDADTLYNYPEIISKTPLSIKGENMFYNKKGKLKNKRKSPMNNPAQLFVRIFTFPETGKIVLEFEGKTNDAISISLQDAQKKNIFSTNLISNKIEIDLSSLSKGSYFLEGTFGEKKVVEKINLF